MATLSDPVHKSRARRCCGDIELAPTSAFSTLVGSGLLEENASKTLRPAWETEAKLG